MVKKPTLSQAHSINWPFTVGSKDLKYNIGFSFATKKAEVATPS